MAAGLYANRPQGFRHESERPARGSSKPVSGNGAPSADCRSAVDEGCIPFIKRESDGSDPLGIRYEG